MSKKRQVRFSFIFSGFLILISLFFLGRFCKTVVHATEGSTEPKVSSTVSNSSNLQANASKTESSNAKNAPVTKGKVDSISNSSRNVVPSAVVDKYGLFDRCSTYSLYYYNAFLTGNHSRGEGADVEGSFAIEGNAEHFGSFNYGTSFAPSSNAVGEHVGPDQGVSLLLGGTFKFLDATGKTVIISGDPTNKGNPGAFIYKDSQKSEIEQLIANQKINAAVSLSAPDNQVSGVFNQLNEQNQKLNDNLNNLVAKDKAGNYLYLKSLQLPKDNNLSEQEKNWILEERKKLENVLSPEYLNQLKKVSNQPGVYILDLTGQSHINIDFKLVEKLANNKEIKQIIVYSDKEKIVEKMSYSIESGEPLNWGETYRSVAKTLSYFYPNATQITNFQVKDTGDFPQVAESSITSDNKDFYDEDYFQKMDILQGMIVGSTIAPNATVVWNGQNINGYIFAKNLHGRGQGFEVHNIYNQYVYDFFTNHHVTLKKVAANTKKGLAGAKFQLLRKEKGNANASLESYRGEGIWKSKEESPKVIYFVSDFLGNVFASFSEQDEGNDCPLTHNQTKKQYNYYFQEVSAPEGYELDKTLQEVLVDGTAIQQKEFVNQKKENSLKFLLQKVDGTTNQSLAGAKFQIIKKGVSPQGKESDIIYIYNQDGQWKEKENTKQPMLYTSNSEGLVEACFKEKDLEQPADFNYYFQEVVAPAGYKKDTSLYKVELNQLKDYPIVKNYRNVQKLPSTGSSSKGLLLIIGSIFCIIGGFYYKFSSRRV